MRKKGGEFKAPEKLREEIRKMEYSFCYKHGTKKNVSPLTGVKPMRFPLGTQIFFVPHS